MRAVQSLLPVIIRLQFIGFTCIVFTCKSKFQQNLALGCKTPTAIIVKMRTHPCL